jgi:hypothetical protein
MLGGSGIALGLRGQPTNALSLSAGQIYNIPSGNWYVTPGPYTSLQYLEPVTGIWRNFGASPNQTPTFIVTDGGNYRLANLTGCPVGAIITNAGATGLTTGIGLTATTLGVAPSAGASVWSAIVGGAMSLTVTTGVTGATAGNGFLYPPTIVLPAPQPGGFQATATATVTGGTLLAAQVTITNQGAGYVNTLSTTYYAITVVNDPRDTAGNGANLRIQTTGTGTVTMLYPVNPGNPVTAVPTFTFTGGGGTPSLAATPVMNFTVTTFTTGLTAGVFATASTPLVFSSNNVITTATANPVYTNPLHMGKLTFPRPARISCVLTAGSITVAGATIEDAGFGIQGVPTLAPAGVQVTGFVAGQVQLIASVGGTTDTSWLQPV